MLGKSGEEDESGKEASGLLSRHWQKPKPCLIAYFGSWENVSWRILFRNFKGSFVERDQEVYCSCCWRRETQVEPQCGRRRKCVSQPGAVWNKTASVNTRPSWPWSGHWLLAPGPPRGALSLLRGTDPGQKVSGGTTPALKCSSPDRLWCWGAEYCELEDGLQAVKCERCLLLWISRWHRWMTLWYY